MMLSMRPMGGSPFPWGPDRLLVSRLTDSKLEWLIDTMIPGKKQRRETKPARRQLT